jgi:hypothetical protein
VPSLPTLFICDKGRPVWRRRVAAFLLDHLLRTEALPHLVADLLVERDDPEDALRVILTSDTLLLGKRRGGGRVVSELQVEGDVPRHLFFAVER